MQKNNLKEPAENLRGEIWDESAVQPPMTRFLPMKAKREQMTKARETRERTAELPPPIL